MFPSILSPKTFDRLSIRLATLFALIVACLVLASCAQTAEQKVPFVGCRGDGQTGPVDAPSGDAQTVTLDADTARELAFYQASNNLAGSLSVLAPRGWHCFFEYGSSGITLLVAPTNDFDKTPHIGVTSPGIVVSISNGDTSGRFEVAAYAARLFPEKERDYVQGVIDEGFMPKEEFTFGPYPDDILVYKSATTVEFETPANRAGIGNFGLKSSEPIFGVVTLSDDGDAPNLYVLTVRLPPELRHLKSAIIGPPRKSTAK
jgi:hypothetical protein